MISKGTVVLRAKDVADAEVRRTADRGPVRRRGVRRADRHRRRRQGRERAPRRCGSRRRTSTTRWTRSRGRGDEVRRHRHQGRHDPGHRHPGPAARPTPQHRTGSRTLLDRAQNLRDIVLIESELTRRQADLDSLEHQSAYLADQTSLATITVDIDHATEGGRRGRGPHRVPRRPVRRLARPDRGRRRPRHGGRRPAAVAGGPPAARAIPGGGRCVAPAAPPPGGPGPTRRPPSRLSGRGTHAGDATLWPCQPAADSPS